MTHVYIKGQDELANLLARQVDDETPTRWGTDDLYAALNHAIRQLGSRVEVPYLYTISSGFSFDTYEYTIPAYIQGSVTLQTADPQTTEWINHTFFKIYPDGSGGRKLRLEYDLSRNARLIWWGVNSEMPTTVPTVNANIDADDTSVVTNAVVRVGRSGFIKIDQEWMIYAGLTEGASTTTCTNLIRGVGGSTAAAHTTADSIYWGVAVTDIRTYEAILYEAQSWLHQIYLVRGNAQEREKHWQNLRYAKQLAEETAMGIVSSRPLQIRLSNASMGAGVREMHYTYSAT